MSAATDVTIAGEQFVLVAGGYERAAEAAAPAKPGRLARSTFGLGLGWVADDDLPEGEGGGGWSGLGVVAVNGGGGLEPWPLVQSYADGALVAMPSTTDRISHQQAGNYVFIAMGRYLYTTPALNAGSWTGLTLRQTLSPGQSYLDLTFHRDDVLSARGNMQDILRWDTWSMGSATWRSGEHATAIGSFNGSVLYARDDANSREQLSYGITHNNGTALRRWRWLDAPIVRISTFGGKGAVATRQSLYLIDGQVNYHVNGASNNEVYWVGEPEPLFSHGAWIDEANGDLRFLTAYLGRLYTFLGGRVVEYRPGAERSGWRATGPEARNCWGACVAAGYLIVALETPYGKAELWAFDGVAWWRMSTQAAPGPIYPIAVGGAGGWDLLVFLTGSANYRLFRLVGRSASATAFAPAASWTSPLLTAGDGNAVKAWRKVGAYFTWPEPNGNPASSDPVTLQLEYSIDAGASWTSVASANVTLGNEQQLEYEWPAAGVPVSRFLQLRVSWASVIDWAPVLNRVIADYVLLDTSPRRRRWKLKVIAGDDLVGRDSGVLADDGRTQSDQLWAAWSTQTPVTFRDVDYDATPIERRVRVLDLKETVGKPADAGRWGESVIELTLAEV